MTVPRRQAQPQDAPAAGALTAREALLDLCRHPLRRVCLNWNWKSAVTSALCRAAIFYVANLGAGRQAAVAALETELVFRFVMSGFYGAITQAFRHVRPARDATIAAVVLLPVMSHSLELVVHWQRGTARLAASLISSVAFTALSTAFNIFAMRHGALVVGAESRPFHEDLRRMPRLVSAFIIESSVGLYRWVRAMGAGARPA